MAKNDHFWPFWAVFLVAFDHPTWNWVNQAWISIPLGNAHILRPNLIGATGFATFMKLYQPKILWRCYQFYPNLSEKIEPLSLPLSLSSTLFPHSHFCFSLHCFSSTSPFLRNCVSADCLGDLSVCLSVSAVCLGFAHWILDQGYRKESRSVCPIRVDFCGG